MYTMVMPKREPGSDDNNTLEEHRLLINRKDWLNRLYCDFYGQMKRVTVPRGKKVEMGSGAGFIKKIIPDVITSDVMHGEDIDMVFFAEKMPFGNKEVAAFYLLNTLHHVKDVRKAFAEMDRCLKPGGRVVMIEPANTWWSGIIYRFHKEAFDPQADWKVDGQDRLSDSNIALPWIIFVRDRKRFSRLFPGLIIVKVEPQTPLLYILSGGLSFPQMLPTSFYPVIRQLEAFLARWRWQLGMFMTIELEKVGNERN